MAIIEGLDREVFSFINILSQSIMDIICTYLIDLEYASIDWTIQKTCPTYCNSS